MIVRRNVLVEPGVVEGVGQRPGVAHGVLQTPRGAGGGRHVEYDPVASDLGFTHVTRFLVGGHDLRPDAAEPLRASMSSGSTFWTTFRISGGKARLPMTGRS